MEIVGIENRIKIKVIIKSNISLISIISLSPFLHIFSFFLDAKL